MSASITRSIPSGRNRARPPHRLLALAEGRAVFELAAFIVTRPLLAMLPRGDGHPVLVLPGFLASDGSTAPLRGLLGSLGYAPHGWGLGRNVRLSNQRVHAMEARLLAIHRDSGRRVSLIGWSLGGVFARELAKLYPQAVRQVITLGSPIHDDRGYTNAAGLFEFLNGPDPEPLRNGRFAGLGKAPPVPTTSILTRSDGIVSWQASIQRAELASHAKTENIEVRASHCGMVVNPSVMVAIADRLAQSEDDWKPFVAPDRQSWMFPQRRLS